MAAINAGEIHTKEKITCITCHSQNLKFIEVIQISQKEGTGGVLGMVGGRYAKNTFRSAHLCKDCGRVSLYPAKEA